MKIFKLIFIFALIVITPNIAFPQWTPTNGPYGGWFLGLAQVDNKLIALTGRNELYISEINSIQWSKIPNFPEGITKIFNYEGALYAATPEGLYISTDLGANWSEPFPSFPYKNVINLLIRGNLILATAISPSDGYVLNVSYDKGITWSDIRINGNSIVTNIFEASPDGRTIALGMVNGMYLSTEGGVNWERILRTEDPNFTEIKSFYFSGDTLLAGSNQGFHYSFDKGKTWNINSIFGDITKIVSVGDSIFLTFNYGGFGILNKSENEYELLSRGLEKLGLKDLLFTNDRLFVATNPGCLVSTDMGAVWQEENEGIKNVMVLGSFNVGNRFFISTLNHGLQYTSDYGETWTRTPKVGAGEILLNAEVIDSVAYGLTYGFPASLMISTDQGITWKTDSSVLSTKKIYSLLPLHDGSCFAGTAEGIYKRKGPDQWEEVDSNLRETSILSLSKSGGSLFAGSNNGILKSSDGGATWNYLDYPFEFLSAITTVSADNLVIAFSESPTVYISTDEGTSWTERKVPAKITQRPFINGKSIFICFAKDNIYYSNDNASTWKAICDAIADEEVYAYNIFDDRIFAVTLKSGIYQAKLADLGASGAEENFAQPLPRVFPNPASDFIILQDAGPFYSVDIYNSMGNKVISSSGQRRINVGDLPQGAYFSRIVDSNGKVSNINFIISR